MVPPAELDAGSAAYAAAQGRRCAHRCWTPCQAVLAVLLALTPVVGLILAPGSTWIALSVAVALVSAATLGLRLLAMLLALRHDPSIEIEAEAIAAVDRADLPSYAVLVPLYREPEVVPALLAALEALDYPRERLDVQLLLEGEDEATVAAIDAHALPAHVRVTVAPPGQPRTKPRACNHGLASARPEAELLVIFDAEDRPEPDQLLKAALAYRDQPADVVCLQCRLDHYNSRQSLCARWTAIDYLLLFRLILPGFQRLGIPIPLGGTSNHFRLEALRALGGWDPFNVTEDCDLGLRIARRGWRTRMLAATTWEEAVTTPRAWIRQRSRWIKGFLQTWMVHARRGEDERFRPWQWLTASINTIGLVAALWVNPLAWAVVLAWLAVGWSVVDTSSPLSIATLVVAAALLVTNPLMVLLAAVACARQRRYDLVPAALLSPVAWALQSLAAWRAGWEYLVKPHHWQKTQHGRAVADHATRRRPLHALATGLGATALAGCLLLLAGWRIGDDVARQAAARRGPPPPVQLPLVHVGADEAAVSLPVIGVGPWRESPGITPPASPVEAGPLRAVADFPTTTLGLGFDPSVLGEAVAVALDARVPADAPDDLRARVHWRDGDGRWYQQVSPQRLVPGSWTRLEFPLLEPDGWEALDHQRAWHPDLLHEASELALALFSARAYQGVIEVANPRAITGPAPTRPLRIVDAPEEAEVMQRWELAFDPGRSWPNPFDPEVVAIDALVTDPAGAEHRVPAFYAQDYQRELVDQRERFTAIGAPQWRVRYRPRQPGHHAWRLELRADGGAVEVLARGGFSARDAEGPVRGHITRSAAKPELLAYQDGSFFYPIGHNICQAVDLKPPVAYSFEPPVDQGSYTYDRYLKRMHAAGMNAARIWLTPWSYGLEGRADWHHFRGAGRYNLAHAWKLDRLLDQGEALGVHFLLTFTHQSELNTRWGNRAWQHNALNAVHGGPLRDQRDFLHDEEVMRLYRQRARYLVARYGDSPSVLAWELFGEVNLVQGFEPQASARWHRELITHLRALDRDRHLVFSHTHNWQLGHELWRLEDIDCVQGNGYIRPPNSTPDHVRNFDRYLSEVEHYHKPIFVAEYGGRSELGAPSQDYLLGQFHSGLWASFVRPFAGVAMHWWWNFVDGADLYPHYAALGRFAAGIDRLERDYHPVRCVVRGGNLAAAGMQDRRGGFYWIHDRGIFTAWADLPRHENAGVHIPLSAGRYRIEYWDTLSGEVVHREQRELDPVQAVPLPPFTRDLALKVERVDPTE